jgi:hypothetical protein
VLRGREPDEPADARDPDRDRVVDGDDCGGMDRGTP